MAQLSCLLVTSASAKGVGNRERALDFEISELEALPDGSDNGVYWDVDALEFETSGVGRGGCSGGSSTPLCSWPSHALFT